MLDPIKEHHTELQLKKIMEVYKEILNLRYPNENIVIEYAYRFLEHWENPCYKITLSVYEKPKTISKKRQMEWSTYKLEFRKKGVAIYKADEKVDNRTTSSCKQDLKQAIHIIQQGESRKRRFEAFYDEQEYSL